MINRLAGILALFFVAGCTTDAQVSRVSHASVSLPQGLAFGPAPAPRTLASNSVLARDFMRLAFQLENGRPLPVLSKFEGPVSVGVTGRRLTPVSSRDLDLLVARLRDEAGMDITRRDGPGADISIELIDGAALSRNVPNAACFVAPNVSSWSEFLRARGTATLDWTTLTRRESMSVFIPADVSAQEIRDCLHEEIAQALGPVNDLYDLTDSIFNDDNFHTVLTGFDMAILRIFYDPALASGMSRDEVRRRLPAILERQRPGAGRVGEGMPEAFTPANWRSAIEDALGAQSRDSGRLRAAERALAIARSNGWRDNRMAFSLYAASRLTAQVSPERALEYLAEADRIYRNDPDTRIHSAHVAAQAAAFALATGNPHAVIGIVDANIGVTRAAQNGGLLASLLLLKSAALEQVGQSAAAAEVRTEALGWARYGFASEREIRQRLEDVEALASRANYPGNG